MFGNVGPTFFSFPPGDHTPGDGLTKLQLTFAGGSTTDESAFAVGAGTEVSSAGANVVATAGVLAVKLSGAVNNYHQWSKNGLAMQPDTGFTCEVFVRAEEFDANPAGSGFFIELDMFNMNSSRLGFNGFAASKNTLRAYANTWYDYSNAIDIFDAAVLGGTYHHIAWVCNNVTDGSLRVYVNGVLVVTYVAASPNLLGKVAPYLGELKLGGVGASFNQTNFYFSGARVRHAEMYTGASFTPPTSPADWGPP